MSTFRTVSLADLASKLLDPHADSPPKVVATAKRIRGVLNGQYIFDSTSTKLVWEHQYFPQHWIPRSAFLDAATFTDPDDGRSLHAQAKATDLSQQQQQWSVVKLSVGDKTVDALVVGDGQGSELAGLVKIDFKALDTWYEEQAQILYHPKDPFHRVDILPSGRHVRVELDGVVLADTGAEGGVMSLWETRFPARWYLPPTAVKWEHLRPSDTHTGCPYKGQASYYHAVVGGKETRDVVWWYPNPTAESALIAGLLCFYPDKVDIWVDGKPIEKIGVPVPSIKKAS
ncbi:hypothetical protein A1O3_02940 [Capronia epimyces CBS 606.96]|uniref:DUF427 domain-containing protein n=1 Tax=Capronia epimyces CBS 606.96 TaxID=1182542 RepID=W9YBL6_9EURO|nr:uncharacterized protein A1O3_02940 [Capronia epimyces CBS 606.96]EXJ89873.1 hypothetical protein A1O3_02940 [Capronia epimyces CBS 606.96]